MTVSKENKRKGPQTTPSGTRAYKPMLIGTMKSNGRWSSKRHWGPRVVAMRKKSEE